ncbi:LacI family DNA-binding transcriptional regulator [Goekera deserti]|uniref:LacI family transcriptional regulator n=1 Tax=Goekera deserti TaxID=2497753 RepID=A0A7K3WFP8_9ACTN|nr:LacI family DNA-binding transcriptional regulator [Goekera deserti]NDI50425.1 substrate-binding domain-containing protein [Goekera deserti]NEL55308.1 LacI family transcriptional regulator [Goekera deserti]
MDEPVPRVPANRPGGRARAADVAAAARVSIATVSLVANGKAAGRVSMQTQARVEQVIEQLGYVADPAARSLVTGRRQCIALLAHDITNPFISLIAAGVTRAVGTGTQLLLASAGADVRPDLARIAAFGVDGILVDHPASEHVAGLGVPVVHLDDPDADESLPRAYFDLAPGGALLAGHLAGLGHRRLLYLDATRPWATFARRRTHLLTGLSKLAPDTIVTPARSDIDIDTTRQLVRRTWPRWRVDGVTAIVTATDVQAFGVLAGLADLGVSVPGQVSVASFDSVPFAQLTAPPLTAVALPAEQLGHTSATLLLALIDGRELGSRVQVIPSSLDVRSSTGPAVTR